MGSEESRIIFFDMKNAASLLWVWSVLKQFNMNLIEHWSGGIPRIIGKVKAIGLQEPDFIGGDVDFRFLARKGQSRLRRCTQRLRMS